MKSSNLLFFVFVFLFLFGCHLNKPTGNTIVEKINISKLDTIQYGDTICLRSFFHFDYGVLVFLNPFEKGLEYDKNNPFVNDLYLGFKVIYKNNIYDKIISLDCADCFNYFGMYTNDFIDNQTEPLFVESNTLRYIIMEGYYYGCNGSFCNFGSILILKFKEKELQQIYLFGIDKTSYSLNEVEANILENENLSILFHSNNNSSLNLIFSDKIELKNKELNLCELSGITCIR